MAYRRAAASDEASPPLVEMRHVHKRFGGVRAVVDVSLELAPGEVIGIVGHNGAGKSVLMKILSGAHRMDSGEIYIRGTRARIQEPRDSRNLGVETIYQTLALADNIDAAGNLFLGREIRTRWGTLDDDAMEYQARRVIQHLNPNFTNVKGPVRNLSGGQRQSVAIARAVFFNAAILIMDEPTAALGPHETAMVNDLIKRLKQDGVGIFLISHDLEDVFDLSDRIAVMKNGRLVGTVRKSEVTKDEVLGMIILGKRPAAAS